MEPVSVGVSPFADWAGLTAAAFALPVRAAAAPGSPIAAWDGGSQPPQTPASVSNIPTNQ